MDENIPSKTLSLQIVHPDSSLWPEFIDLSVEYITANWPTVLNNTTSEDFRKSYETKQKQHLQEGVRGLFIAFADNNNVGLANVYLSGENGQIHINIAEFYIKESERKKGFGQQMKQLIENWGKRCNAQKMLIDVDKDHLLANAFWSSFPDLELDSSSERNLYFKFL
jgi:predicted acetyltransferase